ncbi:MAG: lipoate--protein ligase family protein, partial [Candidatus Cloacimonadota bacterium]|nr:lipoate--protein ligase family protein [Candidatus Cloacimonadota bacterium]
WRFIISGKMAPAENMAIDEAILLGVLKGVSPQTIRVYDWDPPTVSFGFHQNIEKQIDLGKVKKYGLGIVRRPTGGRAVLHYDEVTYAVIADTNGIMSGSILKSYQKIGSVLIKCLDDIGIYAEMEDGISQDKKQKDWSNPCFASASKYEIHYKHKKIIGSAQIRKNNVLLQHGSILLNHNQELMAELVPFNNASDHNTLKKLLSQKTIAINQILDEPISFNKFVNTFKKNFEKKFELNFLKDSKINRFEKTLIEELSIKYKNYNGKTNLNNKKIDI